jgi:hypothetical protein
MAHPPLTRTKASSYARESEGVQRGARHGELRPIRREASVQAMGARILSSDLVE